MLWYNLHARGFERDEEELCWKIPKEIIMGRIMNKLNPRSYVLDVGCGPTLDAKRLINKNVYYVGIDFSKELLKIGKKKHNSPLINLILADVEKLPFKEEVFDMVFCFGVLHHLPDYLHACNEIFRVLKRGGYFLSHEPSIEVGKIDITPHERGIDVNKVIKILCEQGKQVTVCGINIPSFKLFWRLAKIMLRESRTFYILKTGFELLLDWLGRKLKIKCLVGVDWFFIIRKN
jgi:SAM-dependent methyltransferase